MASRPSLAARGMYGPSTSRSSAPITGMLTAFDTRPPWSAAATCSAMIIPARTVAPPVDSLDSELAKPVRRDERVVRDDAHAEPRGTAGDLLADPSETEDAERLVGQLHAAVRLALPPALLERCVGLRDVSRQCDEQADR